MRSIEFLNADHCRKLAPRIRQADRDEVWASHHILDMETCLITSMEMSHESWAWVIDGRPIAAFGMAPGSYLMRQGIPWLLGSDEILENKYAFIKYSKMIVDYWADRWDLLANYVDARNHHSIRWLKNMGFVLDDPAPWGLEKLPFHRFELRGGYHV